MIFILWKVINGLFKNIYLLFTLLHDEYIQEEQRTSPLFEYIDEEKNDTKFNSRAEYLSFHDKVCYCIVPYGKKSSSSNH